MWEEKKWTELEDFEDQIQKWLMFLLSLVDITQTSAVKCYKRFISGEFICCNPNQRCIRSEVSIIYCIAAIFARNSRHVANVFAGI